MKTSKLSRRAGYVATVLMFCALSRSAFAAGMPDEECPADKLPAFADYAVRAESGLKRPKLKLSNEFSRMFKTRLGNGLRGEPVDFAGHYILLTIGCGNGCLYGGYIDAETGQAAELPFSVSPPGLFRERDPIERKADSRLLIVNGNLNEAEGKAMRYFFALQDNKLEPICYTPLDADTPSVGHE